MNDIMLSAHAVERFQERFAGNLSWERASERLSRLLRRSRFVGTAAGRARKYALGDMRFVVQSGVLVTVYRQHYRLTEPAEDLWCLAV